MTIVGPWGIRCLLVIAITVVIAIAAVRGPQQQPSWWTGRPHLEKNANLTRMARQFLACPATEAGVERLFSKAGKCHDGSKKSTKETTIQSILAAAINSNLPNVK